MFNSGILQLPHLNKINCSRLRISVKKNVLKHRVAGLIITRLRPKHPRNVKRILLNNLYVKRRIVFIQRDSGASTS